MLNVNKYKIIIYYMILFKYNNLLKKGYKLKYLTYLIQKLNST